MNVDALVFGAYIQNWEFILEDFTFDEYVVPLLGFLLSFFFNNFGLEINFIQ